MARKPSKTVESNQEVMSPEAEKQAKQMQSVASTLTEAAAREHEEAAKIIHQRTGRRQAYRFMSKLLTAADLADLQNIKKSKAYKGYVHIDESGNRQPVSTWDEYCEIVEGRSRQSVDNDLLNFEAFGPELFDSMRDVGLGPGTMRSIRKLPADEQDRIRQLSTIQDKDEIAEHVEAILAEQRKEKQELQKKLEEANAEAEAKDRVAAKNLARISELQNSAELIKSKPVDEVAEMLRSQANTSAFSAEAAIRGELAGALEALFEFQAENNLDQTPFAEGLVRQVQVALDDVCSTYGIAVDGGSAVPAWQREDADEVVAQALANEQAD